MALSLDPTTSPHPPANSSGRMILSLLVGLVGFAFVYFSVHSHTLLANLDAPVHDWFFAHRTPLLTTIMLTITNLLAPITFAVIVLVGAACFAFYKKEIWRPLLLVGAMALTVVMSTLIKNIVHRGRPPQGQMVTPLELDFSFPSGHTIGVAVAMFVIAYLIYSETRTYLTVWILGIITAIAVIAVTRLYLGYHWVTDVSASVFLAFIVLGIVMIIDRFKPERIP